MAVLQCEICGGKLKGRPGGIYECEYCGVEYDIAWAKAKIQEIKGTVQVEGTVEVTGTVKLDGPLEIKDSTTVENLLKRVKFDLADSNWNAAKQRFEEVLNRDPECAEAYFGLAMCENKCATIERLVTKCDWKSVNYQRGKNFASQALLKQIEELEADFLSHKEAKRISRDKAILDGMQNLTQARERLQKAIGLLAAGNRFTVGVRSDGTVAVVGDLSVGCRDISNWENIISISAGTGHIVGLKKDGSVVSVRSSTNMKDDGRSNVSGWTDIVAVAAGASHTIGLKKDGKVIAVGRVGERQITDFKWSDIIAICTGVYHTVGLKADGSVVAKGGYQYGQCVVDDWFDIVAIAAGAYHTVGLKANGTVVATGNDLNGQCYVSAWTGIAAVAAGSRHTVGLKANGTVVAVGANSNGQCNVSDWTDIVAIAAGEEHTVGLKSDGTVVATGANSSGQCNVSDWKLFQNFDGIEEERQAVQNAKEEEQRLEDEVRKRIAEEKSRRRALGLCQYCGGAIKGLFIQKCTSCGLTKDY